MYYIPELKSIGIDPLCSTSPFSKLMQLGMSVTLSEEEKSEKG